MAAKSNTYTLPESLGTASAPALLEALRGLRGTPLSIEAGHVRRTSAQSVQVLLAAAAAWRADKKALLIEAPSEDFVDALRLLGLTPTDITAEAAA